MRNNRKSPRTELGTCVDFEDRVVGKALDISEGGIRIATSESISIGTILSVVIPLCYGKIEKGIIKVLALVKWSSRKPDGKYSYGFEFFYVNEFERGKLSSFLSEKLFYDNHSASSPAEGSCE